MSELTALYHRNLLADVETATELEEIKRGAAQGAVRVVREAEAEFNRAQKNLDRAKKDSAKLTEEANRCQATIDALDLPATKKYRKNNHAFRSYKRLMADVDTVVNTWNQEIDNSDAT
jgi:phosphoenolpyruvate-protein kinase (PTS system EI component)